MRFLKTWNFPNIKTFIQNEQTMETDCKKQEKTVCTCKCSCKKLLEVSKL